ncbi:hypothetical protein PspLS_11796 [Pyricularia sp. CBS 133598]|nr:hypothetical protein PspLS_11796 [Pyricularia sp. CBS 133598]
MSGREDPQTRPGAGSMRRVSTFQRSRVGFSKEDNGSQRDGLNLLQPTRPSARRRGTSQNSLALSRSAAPGLTPRIEKGDPSFPLEPPSSSDRVSKKDVDGIDYPEGGLEAWLVVLGSWCAMTAGLGIVNSTGIFEAYVSNTVLSDTSTNAVGWLIGIYVFVSYFGSIQVGPLFDAVGPRGLMITDYYQLLLALSILSGIGNSFLFTPAMGAISHWFNKRRGTASGVAFVGSGFGGVLFPMIFQALIPKVGWPWTMRVIGFVLLVLCLLSIMLCRGRLPTKKLGTPENPYKDLLPSLSIFKDGTGAMFVTTLGVFFVEWAYFVPITFVPSYYLIRQGLHGAENAVNGEAQFAYQLLAILNASSCFGRYLPGYLADKIGRFNTMIIGSLLALISVAALWLPDCLSDQPPSLALLIAFVVIFGFASGANITLTPICIGQLCRTEDYGRYYATAFTVCSFGCLTSIPIAANLSTVTGESGRRSFWALILFTCVSYVAAFACFMWVRVTRKGMDWRTIW